MFEKEYEQRSDGWVEWSEDLWGNKRSRRCYCVPQRVVDCARYNHCRWVRYDGWEARPMGTPAEVVVVERRIERPVVIERRVEHTSTDAGTAAAAAIGGLLGGLIGGALKRDKATPSPSLPAKTTRRGSRGSRRKR